MIRLYTCKTANGYRASIMLEECGLPYVVDPLDFGKGEHKTPAFLSINPLGRLPAIVDDDAYGGRFALSESLAITLYIAEKSGRLIPTSPTERALAWQWSATIVSGFSAAAAGIFFSRQLDAAAHGKIIAKYFADLQLYLAAMEAQLVKSTFLAGETVSFADMMAIPTIARSMPAMEVSLDPFPAIRRWAEQIGTRPAVIRGFAIPA